MELGAIVACVMASTLLSASGAKAAAHDISLPPALASALRTFLTTHSETGADPATQVAVHKVNLASKNKDAYVIYIRGGGWCGSGGCNTAIATRRGLSYKLIAFRPATELPLLLLPSFHNGGRDIAVTLKGALNGDHFEPQRAVMSLMDGRYEFRTPIAVVPSGTGEVLISENSKFVPLYAASSH